MQRRLPQLVRACAFTGAALLGCAGAGRGSIGAVLAQSRTDGRIHVRQVPASMGGAQAGLEVKDEILLVDGRDVRHMSPTEVHDALEGEIGTTVQLTVFRRGRVQRLVVTRTALEKGR